MRWRGARRIGDCLGRCISKFRFSRLLPPDTPRRAVCPGREAPVPGCRVSLLVSRGDGVKGKRGGNRNPPISPCPAERVPPPAQRARNPSPVGRNPYPRRAPSPDLQETHQKTPFCPVIIITYSLQVITCHSCRKIVVRASLPPIRHHAPIPRPPTDRFRFLL